MFRHARCSYPVVQQQRWYASLEQAATLVLGIVASQLAPLRLQTDLDVLVREDLMNFLKEESETRGCTIVYITHIFDGIEDWPTHVGFLAKGGFESVKRAKDIPELAQGQLMELVEAFLSKHKRLREEALARGEQVEHPESRKSFEYMRNNGYSAGRMTSTLA